MTHPGDFSYALRDVHVVFGMGAIGHLARSIDAALAASRLFLVSTPGRAAVVDSARTALGDRVVGEFDRARLHVPSALVSEALDCARAAEPDAVVAIGGGSAIGLGKAMVKEEGWPLVAVPTTYAGSEMTNIWGISDGNRKVTGRSPVVAPRVVVYDPMVTIGMPAHVTGPSGMNAMAHAVEALYSETGSPVASLLAVDGLRRLAGSLPTLVDEPEDRAARADALLGAHLCARALDMTSMGLHHKLCHVLGGLCNLPHALTHAVVLPHVVAFNSPAAPEAVRIVAEALGAANAAQELWRLNSRIGITETLADIGLDADDLDRVVGAVTAASYPNPREVTREGVREILCSAMDGGPPT